MSQSVEAFCEYMDSLVQELRDLTPPALKEFDEKSIHKSRVATRRIKAALDLLKSSLQTDRQKPFAKLGKKLRHRLGPLRDLDVMLGHLDEIKIASLAPGVEWLKQQLLGQRDDAREKSTQKTSTDKILTRLGDWPALRADIALLGDTVHSLLIESVHLQLDRFIENADHLTGDAHPLRISGKALRYTLELLKASGHPIPSKVIRTFKRMQEGLGQWHDYVVLAECAMQESLDFELALHDGAIQRNVVELIRYALKSAQRHLDHFTTLWKEKGAELAATIRENCPLTSPAPAPTIAPATAPEASSTVTEPQTDPGPVATPSPTVEAAASSTPPPAV